MKNFWNNMIFTSVKYAVIFFCLSSAIYSQNDLNLENKYRLALSYEQINQIEKAEQIYRELVNIQPWNTSFFDALNKMLIKQKKYDESILLIENRIKANPGDINLYGMLGSTYYMYDKINEAHNSWERGLDANKNSFVAFRVIANYAIENRAFEKAIEILKRGKSYSSEQDIFSLDLANIYAASMQYKEAIREYCSMLKTKSDNIGVVKSRISSFINRQGAATEVLETIKEFIKENQNPLFYELLSYCYSLIGDYKSALQFIIDYEKMIKGNGNFIFTLAQESFRYRQFSVASEAYDYLIKNYPESPFISVSKIGYAKTIEQEIDKKNESVQSWKPIKEKQKYDKNLYASVIKTYDQLAKEYYYNSIFLEATLRVAEIYVNRLYDYQKADSLFGIIQSKSAFTNYSAISELERGKIYIFQNNLVEAENFFLKVLSNEKSDNDNRAEANFYLGKIMFWRGNFFEAQKFFKSSSENLTADLANDAIEHSLIINITKRDSINLFKYAQADLLTIQNKSEEAVIELKTLGDNANAFMLNEIAKIKLAEILISQDNYLEAAEILENLSTDENNAIFTDKSTFLLGKVYQFGINNSQKAADYYKIILENFINSLYFDMARELFNVLTKKMAK